jgi:transcription initiation factor TFIIF subunit beta
MSTDSKTKKKDAIQEPEISKERLVLQQQQENDNSDDEEFLSESAEVIDANDASQITESLNLDFNGVNQKVWLVRVPRFLAQQWRDKESLHGQELGKIRIKQNTAPGQAVMKLRLNQDPSNIDIPHEYDLQMMKSNVENQYVFTEQNFQKFTPTEDAKTELDFTKKNPKKEEDMTEEEKEKKRRIQWALKRRRRFNKYKNQDGTDRVLPFVKTIPKKTAMVGTIVHEAQLIPSMNDPNYSKIIAARKKLVKEEPRPSVTLLQEHSGVSLSNAGLTLRNDSSTFLKSTVDKKKGDGRAIRMPQKELFDLLFKLFDQYDYWSLKGLKERTKQPEVYLKETLEQIAVLIKKGPYALKYALKREYKELKDRERAARLGDLAKDDEEDEEENEEDVEMEDIV